MGGFGARSTYPRGHRTGAQRSDYSSTASGVRRPTHQVGLHRARTNCHNVRCDLAFRDDAEIVAVGSRSRAAAEEFGDQFGIARRHASYADLVADPTVDVPVTFVPNGNNSRIETRVAAVYVQDQIRPTSWLEIIAGLRFDRFN